MGEDAKEHSEDTPRRGFSRLPLGIEATLHTLHGPKKVWLIDLSQGGALVVMNEVLKVGDCVLQWLHFEAFGTATRRAGSEVGIRFDEPLSHRVIFATRHKAPSIVGDKEARASREAQAWASGLSRG